MFSGKGRNTLRNSTGVFARKDWSNNDAGSSEKRWQTLDLISVMQELKRSLRAEGISRKQEETTKLWDRNTQLVEIQENLSCLPRLQKTE